MMGSCIATLRPTENRLFSVRWISPTFLAPALSSSWAMAFNSTPKTIKPKVAIFMCCFNKLQVGHDDAARILSHHAHGQAVVLQLFILLWAEDGQDLDALLDVFIPLHYELIDRRNRQL